MSEYFPLVLKYKSASLGMWFFHIKDISDVVELQAVSLRSKTYVPGDNGFYLGIKMNNTSYNLTLLLAAALLCACTTQTSSPERHAKHAIYQIDSDHFDPNSRTLITDTIRMSVPFFDQFYQEGKKDRANGLTPQQAKEKENYFRSPEFAKMWERKQHFINTEYSPSDSQKQKNILMNEAIAAYYDGYEGRS